MKQLIINWAIRKAAKEVLRGLRRLAKRTDNKVDDRLIQAVEAALDNKSYMTAVKNFNKLNGK